jgi:hypothetical protein
MDERTISCSDVDAMTGCTTGQKRLMKMLITCNLELSELVDKVLVEAIDASDIGHHIKAESLFKETLALIEKKGTTDDYMFVPVLLHYCAFLHRYKRFDEYELALEEFNRIAALYE